MNNQYKAGFLAIMGAPNAGKSTLLNYLLGEKIAIVTHKPQTTRHNILGVISNEKAQIILWDTPGLHEAKTALNREMVDRALMALNDSDICLWVIDSSRRNKEFAKTAQIISNVKDKDIIVALNKIDLVPHKEELLPLIQEIEEMVSPKVIVPISAQKGTNVKALLKEIEKYLPFHEAYYPEDTLTDQSERDIVSEFIRKAVFNLTNQEIPYAVAVTIDEYKEKEKINHIYATIHVERESQKGVIIGRGGQMLKKIGQSSRLEMEAFLKTKVFLKLFVRTTKDWSKRANTLLEVGFKE